MQRILFWLVYPLLWGISKLPFWLFYSVSDGVYVLVYYVFGYRKKIVRQNLDIAFPDKSKSDKKLIEKRFYHHFCDMFLEMLKSISISEKEMRKRFVFENIELTEAYEKNNQSFLIIMGHYASYEWLGSLQFYMKNTGYGIYKKIKSKPFDELVNKMRARWNNKLIQNRLAPKIIARHQKEGITATYGFMADQSPKASQVKHYSPFFEHQVPFFSGVERIAKTLDIPILFLKINKESRGHYSAKFEVMTTTPNDYKDFEITDAFAKKLEEQIREDPAYYLWTHKKFKYMKD